MAGSEQVNASLHLQSPLLQASHEVRVSRSRFWAALAVIVGAIFIYAGAVKAWKPFDFANDIEHFQILSWPLGIRLALYLPWLEILCGVALLTGRLRSGASTLLTGLMLIFIGATVAARMRGINLDCGCFGSAGRGLGFSAHLVIDLALLSALLLLAFRPAGAR